MSFGPELFSVFARELSGRLLPARVQRIETGDVWAAFRTGADEWLFFSWRPDRCGMGIIGDDAVYALKMMRGSRSSFGEALKKNMLNSSLTRVEQLNADRILVVEFERLIGAGFTSSGSVVFEGTSRNGNLVLLDAEGIVSDAARHVHADLNRYRITIPGVAYAPPPPMRGRILTKDASLVASAEVRDISNIGRPLADAILGTASLARAESLNTAMSGLFGAPASSLILQRIGDYSTVFPVLLEGAQPLEGDLLRRCGRDGFDSLASLRREEELKAVKKALNREIKSRQRHVDGLRRQLSLSERSEEFRRCGELLLSSLHLVGRGEKQVVLTDYAAQQEVVVQLDETLSPVANAELYFKKYKKSRIDADAVKKKLSSLREGIAELEEQADILEAIEDPSLLAAAVRDIFEWIAPERNKKNTSARRRKKEALPPHVRISLNDCDIMVGLNARGNRHVTFKVASPYDLWFHVHELPGAHVILKSSAECGGREELLALAASLAAWFSRARHSSKVQVDYTARKNVRSIPGSAIAHVTYTSPRTLVVSPDLWREYPEAARSVLAAADR